MQVANGRRRSIVVLVTVLIGLFGGAIASAQGTNAAHRFFGFQGDITINGDPIAAGIEIVALVEDEEVGRTTVNQAGAWILDVAASHFTDGSCQVTFIVDGLQVDLDWETCELRVRLSLVTDRQSDESGPASQVSAEPDAQDDSESSLTGEAEDGAAGGANSDDRMEEGDEPGQSASSQQDERAIVRPAVPRTGLGGLVTTESSTNWPRAAAITALLTFGAGVAALLIGRRSDHRA
jgi:hypothetical protein